MNAIKPFEYIITPEMMGWAAVVCMLIPALRYGPRMLALFLRFLYEVLVYRLPA